jgi:hypothetical protein
MIMAKNHLLQMWIRRIGRTPAAAARIPVRRRDRRGCTSAPNPCVPSVLHQLSDQQAYVLRPALRACEQSNFRVDDHQVADAEGGDQAPAAHHQRFVSIQAFVKADEDVSRRVARHQLERARPAAHVGPADPGGNHRHLPQSMVCSRTCGHTRARVAA